MLMDKASIASYEAAKDLLIKQGSVKKAMESLK
jgi:hypothetical protein